MIYIIKTKDKRKYSACIAKKEVVLFGQGMTTSEGLNHDPQEQAREANRTAVSNYESRVRELGFVEASLIGYKTGLRTGYIWHVIPDDISNEDYSKIDQLSEVTKRLLAETRDYRPLRVALTHVSQLPRLQQRYEQANFNLELQPAMQMSEPNQNVTTPTELLLGGPEYYSSRLSRAHALAEKSRENFGDGAEKTMFRGIFDTIGDQDAAAMLKDVTFARNFGLADPDIWTDSDMKVGMMQALELMAEPSRVLEELLESPFDSKARDSIVVLDVTGAIEAGTLKPYFKTREEVRQNMQR